MVYVCSICSSLALCRIWRTNKWGKKASPEIDQESLGLAKSERERALSFEGGVVGCHSARKQSVSSRFGDHWRVLLF